MGTARGAIGLEEVAITENMSLKSNEWLLASGVSQKEICEKYDISECAMFLQWIKQYNGHEEFKQPNSGGAIYMTKGRNTTLDERMEIVSHCISNNKDYGKTIERYGVSYPQIYGWVRKHEKEGTDVLVDRVGKRKDEALMNLDIVKPVFGFFDGFAH